MTNDLENPSATSFSLVKTVNPSAVINKKTYKLGGRTLCLRCKTQSFPLLIFHNLYNKYEISMQNTYNSNMTTDIILNANTKLVHDYKECLLYDDTTELFKDFYLHKESNKTIGELTTYYNKSSKVFPNCFSLQEKKYMFKNISREQKGRNRRYERLYKDHINLNTNRLLTKKFLSEITMHCSRTIINEKAGIEEILDRFIYRDSLSIIHKSKCGNVDGTFCRLKPVKKDSPVQRIKKSIKSPTKKLVVMTSNLLGGFKIPIRKKSKYKRHGSQKDMYKNIRKKTIQIDGTLSATGSYYSTLKNSDRNTKTIASNPNNRLTFGKGKSNNINPFQTNTNFNKPNSRTETPHICTVANKKSRANKKYGACQTQENTKIMKKEKLNNKEKRTKVKSRQDSIISVDKNNKENINLDIKLSKNKINNEDIIPLQKKKFVINHLCKSIKHLLSPIKSNSKKTVKSKGLNSPNEIVFTNKHHHKKSTSEYSRSNIRHVSTLSQRKDLLYI